MFKKKEPITETNIEQPSLMPANIELPEGSKAMVRRVDGFTEEQSNRVNAISSIIRDGINIKRGRMFIKSYDKTRWMLGGKKEDGNGERKKELV